MGALKSELERVGAAGFPKLYLAAVEALRGAARNPYGAQKAFRKALSSDGALQVELELNFLRQVTEDMKSGREPGVDQRDQENQNIFVHESTASNGGGGRRGAESQVVNASENSASSGTADQETHGTQRCSVRDDSVGNDGGGPFRSVASDSLPGKETRQGPKPVVHMSSSPANFVTRRTAMQKRHVSPPRLGSIPISCVTVAPLAMSGGMNSIISPERAHAKRTCCAH